MPEHSKSSNRAWNEFNFITREKFYSSQKKRWISNQEFKNSNSIVRISLSTNRTIIDSSFSYLPNVFLILVSLFEKIELNEWYIKSIIYTFHSKRRLKYFISPFTAFGQKEHMYFLFRLFCSFLFLKA